MTPLRLALDAGSPWANDAGYLLARHRGYYRDEGIELEIARPYSAATGDIRCLTPYRLMVEVERGAGLRSVAAVNDTTFESLIYDRDHRPVDKLLDLEGRRVAVPPSPRLQEVLTTVMEEHAVDPSRVEFLEYRTADPDPLDIASATIDALWGYPWVWQGVLARAAREEIAWYTAPELGAPYTHARVLAVPADRAAAEPELVRAVLRATARGFRAAADDPHTAAGVLAALLPGSSVQALELCVRACVSTWALERWGRHDAELLAPYAKWLASRGLLSWAQGHGPEFTDEYLPAEGGG
ncbi:MAG: ABC transporter substrate-binding protein [Spirochaetaceae bacterium]